MASTGTGAVAMACVACGERIGNARGRCRTCNRFAARCRTVLNTTLQQAYNGDLDALRHEVEQIVYTTEPGYRATADAGQGDQV